MYDLLIKGGRVIDPAQGIDAVRDVALQDGRVAALEADIAADRAREVIAAKDRIVVPGLIDLHTHVYWGATSLGVLPEPVARRSGATTLVDAGSAGPGNFHGFRAHIIERTPVRVLPFLNISFPGIYAFWTTVMVGESGDLRLLDQRECLRVAAEHRDLVVGIKVRAGRIAGQGTGMAPVELALEVAEEAGIPLMTHIDMPPPTRREVLARLRPGDVLTHCYRPFPNAPIVRGEIRPEMHEARARGVILDIGHGQGSFGFSSTRAMLDAGFLPDVISSDVHALCEHGPAFDLLVTMSKFVCLGMPLFDVVRCATQNPAKMLGRSDIGTLAPGAVGDVAVLEMEAGTFDYVDVIGEHVTGDKRLAIRQVVLGGRPWHDATAAG